MQSLGVKLQRLEGFVQSTNSPFSAKHDVRWLVSEIYEVTSTPIPERSYMCGHHGKKTELKMKLPKTNQ